MSKSFRRDFKDYEKNNRRDSGHQIPKNIPRGVILGEQSVKRPKRQNNPRNWQQFDQDDEAS